MTIANYSRYLISCHALIVFSLLLLISMSANAQNRTSDDQAIAGAMGAMDEFILAFNDKNPKAWAASLNYPHVRFARGTVTVWNSATEFSDTKAFETLARSGWDHSHWLTRDVVLVSPEKVHISAVFQRFNKDNEIIGTYQSLYIVTKVAGHWGTQARSSLAP
jgi:hypothetical protein